MTIVYMSLCPYIRVLKFIIGEKTIHKKINYVSFFLFGQIDCAVTFAN